MEDKIQACIDTLRLIRVRAEDISEDGNRIIRVINVLYEVQEEMKKKPEGGGENVCD